MSRVVHYAHRQSVYRMVCGKIITADDRRTNLVEMVTCKICLSSLNSNRISRQKAREEKRQAMQVMRKTTDQNRLDAFMREHQPKQKHMSEEDRMMEGYVPFDPSKDISVEATCMSCGKKYMNKYGRKHGLCSSDACSKEEDSSTDPVSFGT